MFIFIAFINSIIILLSDGILAENNNVCSTYLDYATISFNKNCWYNPDKFSTPVALAARYGYVLNSHSVITEDGYVIQIFRISRANGEISRKPVLLCHGIFATSEFWLYVGNRSVAFSLVEAGYDVWLLNPRGSPHSLSHVNYTTADPQFWKFSFHEQGVYDIPAAIDRISKETGVKKVTYIGHSMGTAAAFTFATTKPAEAEEKLAGLVLLGPVAYLNHVKSVMFTALAFLRPLLYFLVHQFKIFGLFVNYRFYRHIVGNVCGIFPLVFVCKLFTQTLGIEIHQLAPKDVPVISSYSPGSSSYRCVDHLLQIIHSGKFRQYDHSERNNLEIYGSKSPPVYDLAKVRPPTYLFEGKSDIVITKSDAMHDYNDLKTKKAFFTIGPKNNGFNHGSFYFSAHLNTLLYPKLFKVLDEINYD